MDFGKWMGFGKWIVAVAVNGVKNGSFSREWAAMQLGNHYSNGKITDADLQRFDNEIAEYEAEQARLAKEAENEITGEIDITAEGKSADGQ